MKTKVIFSSVAVLLFIGGTISVWKEGNLSPQQTLVSGSQVSTRLVEASIERPEIGYDEWKESHSDRVQLAGYYSKDSDGVYWYHTQVIGADPDTFDTYSDRYAHDASNVYYAGNSDLYAIIGADPTTFQALGDGYAKDKSHAYFRGEELGGADAETFIKLGSADVLYAKDKNVIYRENKKIDGFEPISFRVVEKSSRRAVYLADNQKVSLEVWFSGDQVGSEEIVGADPAAFEVVNGWWTRDKENVFYRTQRLENADPKTFTVFGTWEGEYIDKLAYAKDKENVYFLSNRINGADPDSFQEVLDVQILFGIYGKDKNYAYKGAEIFPKNDLVYFQRGKLPPSAKNLGDRYYLYRSKVYYFSPPGGGEPTNLNLVLTGVLLSSNEADLVTFKVLKNGYARDKEHIYLDGNILTNDLDNSFVILKSPYSKTNKAVFLHNNSIEGAQSDSFEILSFGYAKDAQSVFYNDKRVEGADPTSFKILGRGLSSEIDDLSGERFYYNYAQDVSGIFCEGSKLTDADINTFILKGKNGMPQDENHSFDGCEAKDQLEKIDEF